MSESSSLLTDGETSVDVTGARLPSRHRLLVPVALISVAAVGCAFFSVRHASHLRSVPTASPAAERSLQTTGFDDVEQAKAALEEAELLTNSAGAFRNAENTLQIAIDLEESRLHSEDADYEPLAAEPSKYDCFTPTSEWDAAKEVRCCLKYHMGCPTDDPDVPSVRISAPWTWSQVTTEFIETSTPAAVSTPMPTMTSALPSMVRGAVGQPSTPAAVSTPMPTMTSTLPSMVHGAVGQHLVAEVSKHSALASALGVASVVAITLCACAFVRSRAAKSQADREEDEESDGGGPPAAGAAQARTPATRDTGPRQSEIDRLVADALQMEPTLALPPPPPDHSSLPNVDHRAEAAREVERILAAGDMRTILSGGKEQRSSEFRRLVLLLHPDKQLVSGERASLAVRRLVESYRALRDSGR